MSSPGQGRCSHTAAPHGRRHANCSTHLEGKGPRSLWRARALARKRSARLPVPTLLARPAVRASSNCCARSALPELRTSATKRARSFEVCGAPRRAGRGAMHGHAADGSARGPIQSTQGSREAAPSGRTKPQHMNVRASLPCTCRGHREGTREVQAARSPATVDADRSPAAKRCDALANHCVTHVRTRS